VRSKKASLAARERAVRFIVMPISSPIEMSSFFMISTSTGSNSSFFTLVLASLETVARPSVNAAVKDESASSPAALG
jgi:hypothetical protein